MLDLIYLNDGTPEEQVEGRAKKLLEKEGLFVQSRLGSKRVLSYCGFIVSDDFILVSLPKTLTVREGGGLHTCRVLYKTLLRYFREVSTAKQPLTEASSELVGDLDSLKIFDTYNELLEDWSRSGVYKNRIKKERIGLSGRVNWKKTIQHVSAYHDDSGAPVYPAFYSEKRDLRLEGMVSDIHRWCVANADFSIGWMKTSGNKFLLFPEIATWRESVPCDKATAIAVLNKELRKQYDQRKLHILRLMRHLIEKSETGRRIEIKAFGVRYFWPIWESICRSLLCDESVTHSKSLPRPKYLNRDRGVMKCSSGIGQRPDIVVKTSSDNLAIVDAKYYDVRFNVPGWQDIVKQFFYATSYEAVGYATQVSNSFLFPMPNITMELPANIEMDVPKVVSDAGTLDKEYFDRLFKPVKCRYLDMQKAMQGYVNHGVEKPLRDSLFIAQEDT